MRLYLATDTRTNYQYDIYIGNKRKGKIKKGDTFIKTVNVICGITNQYIKQKVDLRVIDITKKAIWTEIY